MTKSFKFFTFALALSIFLGWGTNIFQKKMEDFFFLREIARNPAVFAAKINLNEVPKERPLRNSAVEELTLDAKSAISIKVNADGSQKALFKKNNEEVLPIASLTKLMVAHLVLKYYDPSLMIEFTKAAINEEGDTGDFKIGEKFQSKDLLYPLLIESSNDSARAFSEIIGEDNFVELMNLEAEEFNLKNTHFVNPTGVDPDLPETEFNHSTANDLARLTNILLKQNPSIFEILSIQEKDFYKPNGVFHHRLLNTNELLTKMQGIVGGKTGWTPLAKGCLILIVKAPKGDGYLINVVLGSDDRFEEMKKMVNWVLEAYRW